MGESKSRRLRLRLFSTEIEALAHLPETTALASKSGVVRGALALLEQVYTSQRGGFRVVYRRAGVSEWPDVLDDGILRRRPERKAASRDERVKTERFVEIRVSRADNEKIEALLAMQAGNTASEVVRRAIRLYAAAAERVRNGWEIVALSPKGEALRVATPGLGQRIAHEIPAQTGRTHDRGSVPGMRLTDFLPRSLAEVVRQLAEHEGCNSEMLLVDLVRTEAYHRLRDPVATGEASALAGLDAGLSISPLVEPAEPASTAPATAAHGEPVTADESRADDFDKVATTDAPDREAEAAALGALDETLDRLADNVEKVGLLAGETSRAKGQQADFSDLLFTVSDETDSGESDASPLERLCRRAQDLNERMSALIALTHREKKPRAARSDKTGKGASKASPEADREPHATPPSSENR